ncbi:MbnP family protein [Sphingobacterium phlebotomi]|nr:MbnP family protein [Sphingobacterium phlebotomi]
MREIKIKINWKNMLTAFIACCFLLSACKKDDDIIDENKMGDFSIEFDHIVGEDRFYIDPNYLYRNAKGEQFSIRILMYYISNIKLYKADGSSYTVPQDNSYFMVNGADRTTRFTKVKVPEGDYTKVEFMIGVDQERNMMPMERRTGVLSFNPGEGHAGMFWTWSQGYIFFKLEGNSDVVSDDQSGDPTGNKQFKYHIGGFGYPFDDPEAMNNIKIITVDLTKTSGDHLAHVREGLRSNVHLMVDVMQIFNGPYKLSIADKPNVMFNKEDSGHIAGNFASLFTHDHSENYVRSEEELSSN